MKTLIEFNAILFLASCAILYFVLKYRIHLHVEYSPRKAHRAHRRGVAPSTPSEAPASPVSVQMLADLESALVNLGASKPEARTRAAAAIAQGPGDFDALILRAMQAGPERTRANPRRLTE
jgi:hypothetical protein